MVMFLQLIKIIKSRNFWSTDNNRIGIKIYITNEEKKCLRHDSEYRFQYFFIMNDHKNTRT